MGFDNRIGPPFEASPQALKTFEEAVYMSCFRGLELDGNTSEITTNVMGENGPEPFKGSPGEVLTHEGFYIPDIESGDMKKLIDLAFILGYGLAKIEDKQELRE